MRILADENIPLVEDFFAGFGEIRRQPGRAFTAEALASADVLLVRSVTRVDARLLAGSPVTFCRHLHDRHRPSGSGLSGRGRISPGPARRAATPAAWWITCWAAC